MEQEFDFLTLGKVKVHELLSKELKEYANFIEQNFGENAKMEFEAGVAMSIPQYAQTWNEKIEKDQLKISFGKIITDDNKINNSYFGQEGISEKYIDEENSVEPITRKIR